MINLNEQITNAAICSAYSLFDDVLDDLKRDLKDIKVAMATEGTLPGR